MLNKNAEEYQKLIRMLCRMDEDQLLEMYHDMLVHGQLLDVDRIADTAYHFVISHVYQNPEQTKGGISDIEDYIAVDNARRAREFA